MPSLFGSRKSKTKQSLPAQPPEWAPAPETSHKLGLVNEAPEQEFEAAEVFCTTYPVEPPRLLPTNVIERINAVGCKVWGLETPRLSRFIGCIRNPEDAKNEAAVARVETSPKCGDTCILSNYPLVAGLYETKGKQGAYYEVTIIELIEESFIAVGTACRPYPEYRLPGWNRLSAGLHLDDMRKFFEDPCGGRDYVDNTIKPGPGDTIGCGFEFQTGTIFFTYNGMRLPDAFTGVYIPRTRQDVYAAVGVSGAVIISVNFGGDHFRWLEGNEWSWRVEGQVGGQLGAAIEGAETEDLPSYREASLSSRTYE